jgi:TrmH family RNA methyltransferase
LITSRSNTKIKQARALKKRKERQKHGFFLVEGIRQVGAAVEAGAELRTVFYAPEILNSTFAQELIKQQSERGIPCYATTAEVFSSISERENPQGLLGVVHQREMTLADINPINFDWGVALVAPQDPGNVGTILRTIDAVGASGLLLLDSSVDPSHPTAVRASMGSLFWHPVINASFDEFTSWVRRHDYGVYGTSARGDASYESIGEYERPLVLLMGSEREGLTPEQAAVCDALVRLPMRGQVSSLNLAVATGVMLYEMYKGIGDREIYRQSQKKSNPIQ